MKKIVLFILFISIIASCKLDNDLVPLTDFSKAQSEMQKNQGRSVWQKPNLVINKLGDISNKTVVDIGAGTGFFSFRLAMRARKIISTEIDSNMIKVIELQKENLPQEISARIETRLVEPSNSGIKRGEADIFVIVNTITLINKPDKYLQNLYEACDTGNQVLVVDFKKIEIDMPAPSIKERMDLDEVVELLTGAGFKVTDQDENTLDYQYIVLAEK
jgi:ubiquinone/menaquinone biosynthesis C-methylase UbiE